MTIDLSGNSANTHFNNSLLTTLSYPTIITTTGARTPGLRAPQAKLTELQFPTKKAPSISTAEGIQHWRKASSAGGRLSPEQENIQATKRRGRRQELTQLKERRSPADHPATTSGTDINAVTILAIDTVSAPRN
jgi:hypothetical protein